MFRKRQKKYFPPDTFIPKPARICAIIQLCLAFSVLLWNASEPFVGEIFTLKSRLLFYQDVMGIPAKDNISIEKVERLNRNADRFKSLPNQTKNQLVDNYQVIQKQLQRSFLDKITSVISLFAHRISPYELAWIFFSIVISILLLKRIEGAAQAVWLLPLLAAAYAVDSRWYGTSDQLSLESRLFPSEKELIENYIKEQLSHDVFVQQEQLLNGWKRYLIVKWGHQHPSEDHMIFEKQTEDAEFNFTLARLELRSKQKDFFILEKNQSIPSYPLLILYFFWNTYFAYTAWTYAGAKNTHEVT